MVGGAIGEHWGKSAAFVAAGIICLLPLVLIARWNEARDASAN
jgi:hypothetical protein